MEKIKWHYDKKFKQWWAPETVAYANDGFTIRKDGTKYQLDRDHGFINRFHKLSSAKTVANLLRHG